MFVGPYDERLITWKSGIALGVREGHISLFRHTQIDSSNRNTKTKNTRIIVLNDFDTNFPRNSLPTASRCASGFIFF